MPPWRTSEGGEAGAIDTVVTAFTDMQGRLFGKRIEVQHFLDEVTEHGVEGCNYLLALDMEMKPVPGYEMANWEKGYGDFGSPPTWGLCAYPVARPHGAGALRRRSSTTAPRWSPRPARSCAQYERAREMG